MFWAVFSKGSKLLYSSPAFTQLIKDRPENVFINPTLLQLWESQAPGPLIFEGYMTLGDYNSINSSINACVYRKDEEILITGEIDTPELLNQNTTALQLNSKIMQLQRNLIREKYNLETTLKKLNTANLELQESNSTKDKFFGIIAHDLRNPFTTLLGFSNFLEQNAHTCSSEEIAQYAQTIHTLVKNSHKLLENLLDWSQLQKGIIKPKPLSIRPALLIQEAVSYCREMAINKNIHIQVTLNCDLALWVDPEMIKSTLRNLVTNSLKFTRKGGLVSIQTDIHNGGILISVSDTGTGIEPVYLSKLFNLDCQLSRPGTDNEEGSGLGLILCKEFVEMNGGKIWVESQPGQGSQFKFTLPFRVLEK